MKQKISIVVIVVIIIVIVGLTLGTDPSVHKVDEMYISFNSVSNQYIVPAQYTDNNEFTDRAGRKYQISDDIETKGLKEGKWYMISFWDHATEDTSDDKVTGYRRRLIPPRTIKKSDH